MGVYRMSVSVYILDACLRCAWRDDFHILVRRGSRNKNRLYFFVWCYHGSFSSTYFSLILLVLSIHSTSPTREL